MPIASSGRVVLLLTLLLLGGVSACSRQPARDAPARAGLTAQVTDEELRQLAAEAYANGDWDRAAQRYAGITRQNPADLEAWFRLGNIHARSGRVEAAVQAYGEVLSRDPGHVRARHNLGIVQVRMAIATFAEMSATADPEDPLVRRGTALSSDLEALLAADPEADSARPLHPPSP